MNNLVLLHSTKPAPDHLLAVRQVADKLLWHTHTLKLQEVPGAFSCVELFDRPAGANVAYVAFDEDSVEAMHALKYAYPHLTCAGIIRYSQETDLADLVDRTYETLLRQKWAVAAGLKPNGQFVVLTSEKGARVGTTAADFAVGLLKTIDSRLNNKHYKTLHERCELPIEIADDVAQMLEKTREWASWSLFPAYQGKGELFPGAEFGFVAKRTHLGTLITARASNKEEPTLKDLALLRSIEADGTLQVASPRSRASLNAPVAHEIFAARPEVTWIVHSHVQLPQGYTVKEVTAPGARGDWEAIRDAVTRGEWVINQPQHGCLILLKAPEDLLEALNYGALYKKQSHLYELAYARFQATPERPTHFERCVAELPIRRDSSVLDLCCGTGASTRALHSMGFTRVDFADGAQAMLNQAEEALGRAGRHVILPDLYALLGSQYDLITMRQAFNYLKPEDLMRFFRHVHEWLSPGGLIAFNTFLPLEEAALRSRVSQFETDHLLVRTEERNVLDKCKVLHTQRTEVFNFEEGSWQAIYDVNKFYEHDLKQVERAMQDCGFKTAIHIQGRSVTVVGRSAAFGGRRNALF